MSDPAFEFVNAACVPLDSGHTEGDLGAAGKILASRPEIATASIITAAILGDDQAVRKFIDGDKALATAKSPPRAWDPLTYLCFSRYLRLDRSRSDGFVRAATALLDAGADANTGWFETGHQPKRVFETVMYGAAGVARHGGVTRVLLDYGADPNDDETPYHVAETYDNTVLRILLESGKFNENSLSTVLLRKTDWHDYDGIRLVLDHGADPNRTTQWGKTALLNAALSDNGIEIFELLLDHGADPLLISERSERGRQKIAPLSVVQLAARRGRGDVLALFEKRRISISTSGIDALLVACAMDDKEAIDNRVSDENALVGKVIENGGQFLTQFAGNGNHKGVERLLNLGISADARSLHGDGYFGLPPMSTALHSAAWRGRHQVVKLLISRGADVDAKTFNGRTPLQLAVRATVDSFWTERRSTESIQALLDAGASMEGIPAKTGYDEADEVFRRHLSEKQRPG
ncbi:MAG TPA: ankyrin repeat domain-containing protein [Gemmatimonadaceae bacterium]|nr:ankyrin repeat domain-containing protein [Gemmatimonadaceae bacterium]